MRRAERKIQDEAEIRDLFSRAPVGRLGTVGRDGYPRIKPLNFVYTGGRLYFHSACEGEKIRDIIRDDRVCFEVDMPFGYIRAKGTPCSASYQYRSVLLTGRAIILEDPVEKGMVLRALMAKYQPEGGHDDIPMEKLAVTAVVRIDIETMTGKENMGSL